MTLTAFADAFYWIAPTNPADTAHRAAQTFEQSLGGSTIVTTDEVLIEFLTFFGSDAWSRLDKGYSLIDCISMRTISVT